MKIFKTIALIVLLIIGVIGCSSFMEVFFPGPSKYRYGFINKKGEVAIQARFMKVKDFSEGLCAVEVNNLWGYIDVNGKMVIRPRFNRASGFSEGLAAVRFSGKSRPYGYIDKKGNIVIKPGFYAAGRFRNGYARISYNYSRTSSARYLKCGYIDKRGRIVVRDRGSTIYFHDYHYYSDGLFPISLGRDRWGFVNKRGKLISRQRFHKVRSFNSGRAVVGFVYSSKDAMSYVPGLKYLGSTKTVTVWGYIDKTGSYFIKPVLLQAYDFIHGLALINVAYKEGLFRGGYYFINPQNKRQIGKEFKYARSYSERLAFVMDDSGSYYINTRGRKVIENVGGKVLRVCGNFHNNAALVSVSGEMERKWKYGYIDRKGRPLFSFTEDARITTRQKFSDGRAMYYINIKNNKKNSK